VGEWLDKYNEQTPHPHPQDSFCQQWFFYFILSNIRENNKKKNKKRYTLKTIQSGIINTNYNRFCSSLKQSTRIDVRCSWFSTIYR